MENTDNYIIKVMVDLGESYNLNEKGLIHFDKWNQGKISDSELKELVREETYAKYNDESII